MNRWERHVSVMGPGRIVAALGGLYVAVAVALAVSLFRAGARGPEVAGRFLMLAVLGAVVLYGGVRVGETDFHPEVRPRIVGWTFGGFAVMVAIVGAMQLVSPSGVDNPRFAVPLATAIGSLGGLGAGVHDARAKTRERELEETVARLRTSNERLEQFAYAASHDLQEPLRMVSSYLLLLERRYADELDEDAEEFIEFAVDGAERMRAMIQSLLEYSRVSRGEPLVPTDAAGVFEDVREDLRLRIEETGATVTADDLPTVLADPDQLAQVFRNLVSNALDHGGGAPPRVHVGVERTNGEWRFAVADEGVGIDPEYHERVFTVFERLNTSDEPLNSDAAGIGLALCERIVERHGGDIWVESEPGEGATFFFTMPAADGYDPDESVPGLYSSV